MLRLSRPVLDGLGAVVRLGLAAVFLVSGLIKVIDPAQTRVAVGAYEILPEGLVGLVATGLPLVELTVGTLLVLGVTTRWVALAAGLLLLMLMTAVAQAWARGLSIDCGCFGGGGALAQGSTKYPQELARDGGFVVLAAWLLVRPQTALSIDAWLRADSRSGWGRAGYPAG